MKKAILFDLDGTLTDSGAGIIHCGQLVLQHYGLPIPEAKDMRWMVGPPLRVSFPRLHIPEEKIEEAIEIYRYHYERTGIFENDPYAGIETLLQKLKEDGHRLFVATSKPEYMALEVLNRFDLTKYFELVCGCQRDGVRDKKADVIAYLLQFIHDGEEVIMVGDTIFDVLGAKEHNIPTVVVGWGYGKEQEMLDAGAVAVTHTMEELYQFLSK